MSKNILLFLDIDGVLSIPDLADLQRRKERWQPGLTAWPIPFAFSLLRLLDHMQEIQPVWMSTWGDQSLLWNDRAGTSRWPVAYPLQSKPQASGQSLSFADPFLESKQQAVLAYLDQIVPQRVVWIEDEFSSETLIWAARGSQVRLIDTSVEPLSSFLLTNHPDRDEAAHRFIQTFVLK